MSTKSRRDLLRLGAGSLGAALVASVTPRALWAAGAGRTLVCVELVGGADTNNLVVPTDPGPYSDYSAARGALTLPQSLLQPIHSNRQNANFGMPEHVAELANLYSQGVLAIVANVGEMPQPLTKAQLAVNPNAVAPEVFEPSGNGKMLYLPGGYLAPAWAGGLLGLESSGAGKQVFTFDNGISLAAEGRAIAGVRHNNTALMGAVGAMPVRSSFPSTVIGQQLAYAARLAAAGRDAGHAMQIITCTMGGFGMGSKDSGPRTLELFRDLSQAVAAFYKATFELGMGGSTTLFTWSEYGRTLQPNALQTAQAGWGSHHIVIGASVVGGEIYGKFPTLRLGSDDDATGRGTLIPTSSENQYAATHGKWLGVSAGELPSRLPGLNQFMSPDLGFYGSVA